MRSFYVDRKGEIPPGKGPYYQMPVMHLHEGYLSTIYARGFIQVDATLWLSRVLMAVEIAHERLPMSTGCAAAQRSSATEP